MNESTNNKEIMTKVEYVAWLETTVASLLKANDEMDKIINSLVRKNMQLEDQEIATTIALIRNPLNSRKEYKA
jgi:hypothetical protein